MSSKLRPSKIQLDPKKESHGSMLEFISESSLTVRQAVTALDDAARLLAESSLRGRDYRAVEVALNRAGNSQTSLFVQEILKDIFTKVEELPQ